MAVDAASWRQQAATEIDDFAHGAAGGFLFGIPLIYTMELWFIGLTISPGHALLLVGLTVMLSLTFVLTIGFREETPPQFRDVVAETIDAVGISLIVAVASLLVLGRIGPDTPLESILGRVAIELLPISLGVAIANHILPRQGDRRGNEEDRDGQQHRHPTVRDLVAAGGGALLLSLNIAPTDEITILASELTEIQLVVLMLFSLGVSYMIVFEAEFRNQSRRYETPGLFHRPITETIIAYLVSLVVCGLVMWLVGAYPNNPSYGMILSKTVVLGFPGALGAAAGRLAV
jgi:putative integral membrane protein (TIGR02587 family)